MKGGDDLIQLKAKLDSLSQRVMTDKLISKSAMTEFAKLKSVVGEDNFHNTMVAINGMSGDLDIIQSHVTVLMGTFALKQKRAAAESS